MQKNTSVLGIWGLGTMGRAALSYYQNRYDTIITLDMNPLSTEEQTLFEQHGITHYLDPKERILFLESATVIIPSPGIDLRPYWHTYRSKWLTEIDEFAHEWHKTIIAITGSVGKTSVTHLLGQLLEHERIPTATGGNIGTPTYQLLEQQETVTQALLELSSFQLEHSQAFVPDYALITNIIPNHLDRHNSYHEYAHAKLTMITRQKPTQKALLALELAPLMKDLAIKPTGTVYYFSKHTISREQMAANTTAAGFFYIRNSMLVMYANGQEKELLDMAALPAITFTINWLTIAALWHLMNIPLNHLLVHAHHCQLPAHRLEPVATINTLSFINDSKSTTPDATRAAVDLLEHRTIILFLGGLSKGVDRAPFIADLRNKVAMIYCFGAEANQLYEACTNHDIPAKSFATLEEAFENAVRYAPAHSTILLSPSGSSYDLFAHYQERGETFKQLVDQYAQNH